MHVVTYPCWDKSETKLVKGAPGVNEITKPVVSIWPAEQRAGQIITIRFYVFSEIVSAITGIGNNEQLAHVIYVEDVCEVFGKAVKA